LKKAIFINLILILNVNYISIYRFIDRVLVLYSYQIKFTFPKMVNEHSILKDCRMERDRPEAVKSLFYS